MIKTPRFFFFFGAQLLLCRVASSFKELFIKRDAPDDSDVAAVGGEAGRGSIVAAAVCEVCRQGCCGSHMTRSLHTAAFEAPELFTPLSEQVGSRAAEEERD